MWWEQIGVERVGPSQYRLTWADGTVVAVSPSLSPDEVPALVGPVVGSKGLEVGDLPAAAQHFFHVQTASGDRWVVADRRIPLQGAVNFRDFGGYVTADGRRVRWGRLFRSGQLSLLTEADQARVAELGIALICDFRRDEERLADPSRLAPQHQPRMEALSIAPGNTADLFAAFRHDISGITKAHMIQLLVDINRELAVRQQALFRRMFAAMLDSPGPVLLHCAAGKDRTGFAAALVLSALGVPETAVMHDYLLTSRYLVAMEEMGRVQEKYAVPIDPENLLPLLEARPEYLQAALAAVREEFGDMETYLREALGVDDAARAELRGRLLVG